MRRLPMSASRGPARRGGDGRPRDAVPGRQEPGGGRARRCTVGSGTGTATWVYDFSEGNKDQKDLLGGKGANLAEMTNLGLPVPPGFTITTDACRYYLEHGCTPPDLGGQVTEHLTALEKAMGKTLGDPGDPLLVSVRSGAAASMPGMMETVLNVGLNDESVQGLAAQSGSERFARDSYRRLIQMFGKTVLGLDGELFEHALDEVKREQGTESGMDSGTGVAFTRDPGTGEQGVYGDYLQNAQGEDVVAGIRNTVPLPDLERIDEDAYRELLSIMSTLESHYRDLCDIEFTVERNKLWMLQTRVGKRTAAAAF